MVDSAPMLLTSLMKRRGWFPLLLAGTTWLSAQETSSKIFFLHLRLESNQVSLVSASIAPGTLKRFSPPSASLELEVATAAGQVLWTNAVADPSIRHLEYEDPQHPGEIISREVQLTNTEFTVRIPGFINAHHVNFYRSQSTAATNVPPANAAAVSPAESTRQMLGTVALPQDAK